MIMPNTSSRLKQILQQKYFRLESSSQTGTRQHHHPPPHHNCKHIFTHTITNPRNKTQQSGRRRSRGGEDTVDSSRAFIAKKYFKLGGRGRGERVVEYTI